MNTIEWTQKAYRQLRKLRNPQVEETIFDAVGTLVVTDHRVRQMRDRGLSAIHMVCEQADNKADVVPCDRLPLVG